MRQQRPRARPGDTDRSNLFFDNPDRGHIHTLVYRAARGTLGQSASVSRGRIERSYQELGPTYGFKNPNHPLAGDPRYSLFGVKTLGQACPAPTTGAS